MVNVQVWSDGQGKRSSWGVEKDEGGEMMRKKRETSKGEFGNQVGRWNEGWVMETVPKRKDVRR